MYFVFLKLLTNSFIITDLPQSSSVLIEKGVIEALLTVLKDSDHENNQAALVWLNHFMKHEQAKERIVRHHNLHAILHLLAKEETTPAWFAAASLLNTILADKKFAQTKMRDYYPQLHSILNRMELKGDPVCALFAARTSILLSAIDMSFGTNAHSNILFV